MWLLSYGFIYLPWFCYLEKTVTRDYHIMHVSLDDLIPFNEYFIIPYLLWFLYVAGTLLFFLFTSREDYYRMCIFLFSGMTISLIICTFFRNGTDFRPAIDPDKNLFSALVATVYKTDTCTNVFPSIHVYNSLGAHFAITHCQRLMNSRHGKLIKTGSGILAFSIVLSTMFIKQHSVFDVFTGLALGAIMYALVYKRELLFAGKAQKNKGKRTPQVD